MIKDVEIRQATAEDIKTFYPDGSPRTCYAWVALYRGLPVCIAGLIIQRTGAIIFSDMLPHGAPKRTAWLVIRELYARIVALGIPFYTAIECDNERSRRLFKHLGMVYLRTVSGEEVYTCPR